MDKDDISDLSVPVEISTPQIKYLGENNWNKFLFSPRL